MNDEIQVFRASLTLSPKKIENVVVSSSPWTDRDLELLFGDEPIHFTSAEDMPRLMVELEAYPSTSKARQAGRVGDIPNGWTEFKASKKRQVWIWNPTE